MHFIRCLEWVKSQSGMVGVLFPKGQSTVTCAKRAGCE